jgi:hypothetical protein
MNQHHFDIPEVFGFTQAIRLSSSGEPGHTIPNDDWGVYADVTGNLCGQGYDLIARGTLAEVKKVVAGWVRNPDTYWAHTFAHRQEAIARYRRDKQQPWMPPIHPAFAQDRVASVA